MPSPIGHALGGIAIAWGVVPRRNRNTAIVLAALALAPDLDLLVGDHRGISHSLGAAVVAGLIAWSAVALRRRGQTRVRPLAQDTGDVGPGTGVRPLAQGTGVRPGSDPFDGGRWAAAVMLSWGSHVLLDWLSNDTRPPLGVMALWPFTSEYFKSSIEIFPPVSRRWGDTRFWSHNLWAAFVELALLVPVVWVVARVRRRR